MADVEVVIKIPEEIYHMVMNTGTYGCYRFNSTEAIRKGTQLPKGHGKIGDLDYLKDVILLHNFHGNNKNIVPYQDRKGYRLRQREVDEAIINAPTIIEADKAESEDKE